MKQKLYMYITNAEETVGGAIPHIHADTYGELTIEGWILVGETEVSVDINLDDLRETAVKNLDNAITETRAKLQAEVNGLETRRQNLLAITYQPSA